MIHSMAGGVLSDGELYLFVKVDGEAAGWYLSLFPVKEGARVLLPFGAETREGTVLKVERCTAQTAPVPVKRALYLLGNA